MVTFGQLAIAFVSYILFGFTFDLMDIPLNSMIPVMSDVDNDRNILSNIKGLAYMTGGILFTAIPVFLMNIFSTKIQAFQILIILTISTVLGFSILGTLGIKEKVKPIEEKKYSIREIIDILGAKPVYILFVEGLFKSIGGGLQMAIMLIFFESVLGNGDLFISIGLTTTIGILIGIVIGPKMIKRYSKKTTRIIAGIFSVLSLTLSFFIPRDQPSLFLLVAFIFAPGGGVNSLLDYGIQADNMDYVEWKLGYRAEGVIASLNSFIVKSAGGIGASIAAYMLFIFRYDQTEGAIQSSFTITGLYIANFGIPAIFTLVGVLIWAFGYPLNRKMRNQMMEELSEKRNVQGTNSS
ncbi:MAG: hypothetical protein GY870_11180 [archaeon]|nr:hypothetical protein [archaeon]